MLVPRRFSGPKSELQNYFYLPYIMQGHTLKITVTAGEKNVT